MTARKKENQKRKIGEIILGYRNNLTDIPKGRQNFINNRAEVYFEGEDWISEKMLANYEKGSNIPSLENIKRLSIALEVDLQQFVMEILKNL